MSIEGGEGSPRTEEGVASQAGLAAELTVQLGEFTLEARVSAGPGEVLALVGPNGSGKTSALRALSGLTQLHGGRIVLDGRVLDEPDSGLWVPPHERGVGMVFQELLLFPHLSARDNVAYGLRVRGHDRRTARRRADEWLAELGVSDRAGARPRKLSGGQAQRVALARALAPEPRLLLLDEPLSALDASVRAETRTLVQHYVGAFGGITILVTHDLLDILLLADRVLVLDGGRIVQVGDPVQVTRQPRTRHLADLAGVNLLRCEAVDNRLVLGEHVALPAFTDYTGPVFAAISPRGVHVEAMADPDGAPEDGWEAMIAGLEQAGDQVRLRLSGPVPLVAEAPADALATRALQPGQRVWVSLDRRVVQVYAAGPMMSGAMPTTWAQRAC